MYPKNSGVLGDIHRILGELAYLTNTVIKIIQFARCIRSYTFLKIKQFVFMSYLLLPYDIIINHL